jgi:type I restriction enzyme S subunit
MTQLLGTSAVQAGAVPPGWTVQPLVALADIIVSSVDKKEYPEEVSVKLCNYTDVYYRDEITGDIDFMVATASADQIRNYSVLAGDVAITKDSETSDDIGISAFVPESLEGVVYGYHLATYRPHDARYSRFLKYVFDSAFLKAVFETQTQGVTRVGLSQQTLHYSRVPVPHPEVAEVIGARLAEETAEIDAFIADQERLIDLLSERRAAELNRVVSSLDGTPKPLKWAAARVTVGIVVRPAQWYVDSGVPTLRGTNVKPEKLDLTDLVSISEEGHGTHPKSRLAAGDVVVVRTGMAGAAAAVPPQLEGANAIDLLIVKPGQHLDGEYLAMVLNSPAARARSAHDTVGTIQGHLNATALGSVEIPLPDLASQRDRVRQWRAGARRWDEIIGDAQQAIALSRERRAALISAAVTGQIEVTGRHRATEGAGGG